MDLMYQEVLGVSDVYKVYQMYINNEGICDILPLDVWVGVTPQTRRYFILRDFFDLYKIYCFEENMLKGGKKIWKCDNIIIYIFIYIFSFII